MAATDFNDTPISSTAYFSRFARFDICLSTAWVLIFVSDLLQSTQINNVIFQMHQFYFITFIFNMKRVKNK